MKNKTHIVFVLFLCLGWASFGGNLLKNNIITENFTDNLTSEHLRSIVEKSKPNLLTLTTKVFDSVTKKAPKPCDIFVPDLVVDNTILLGFLDYRVINSIKVAPSGNVLVAGSAKVEMRAGSVIELNPGFSTQSGARYFAEITPCKKSLVATKPKETLENKLKFYPNPIVDEFTLQIENFEKGTTYLVTVYDVQGVQQLTLETKIEKTTIDLSQYTSGIYIVKVSNGINTYNAKLIKK
ncbi:T9SS type A sorting domain-containing protein [Kordia sp.]|uniref:T9SS type A sorting domain-containing protein n=1 Tax=Kordia sp. TaxID=1965332 RepID=UPI003B5BACE6